MIRTTPQPKRREGEAKHKLNLVVDVSARKIVKSFGSRFPKVVALWRMNPTKITVHTPDGKHRVTVEAFSRRAARKLAKQISLDQWEVVA